MEKNKIIIGALIVVILALLIGILVSMPNFAKADSQLEIIVNDTITEGDNLQVKLTDANGTALSNQTVKITFIDKDNSTSDYSVVTNDEGVGELKLDKNAGEYDVAVIYGGNDGYNSCNATKKLTIEKKVVEAQQSSSNSKSSSSTPYDINNLPPTNDPYPEKKRFYIDEYHVKQVYEDDYMRIVDLRTGEIESLGFGG